MANQLIDGRGQEQAAFGFPFTTQTILGKRALDATIRTAQVHARCEQDAVADREARAVLEPRDILLVVREPETAAPLDADLVTVVAPRHVAGAT